ncbi:hypothetical protein BGZ96_004846 [Linnemannia gamsii]|uniref:Uncharacterized protein n=1 Tax=Linnemannia gamsii TaxID=64522 RepID=A0ABQ7K7I6_9FUNG|nr:hypothetical protein BGZ96_004846 [Linnemannia gamsii]
MRVSSISLCITALLVNVSAQFRRLEKDSPNLTTPLLRRNSGNHSAFNQATCDNALARFNDEIQTCLDRHKTLIKKKKSFRMVMKQPYEELREAVVDARAVEYSTPTAENAHEALRKLIQVYYVDYVGSGSSSSGGGGEGGHAKRAKVIKTCEDARVSISDWFLHLCNIKASKKS